MDRTSFLRAQPFLFPLESVSWPPPLPAETAERHACRRETLLRECWLSIEPIMGCSSEDTGDRLSQQSIYSSGGPAFFTIPKSTEANRAVGQKDATDTARGGNNNDTSFDASMCPFELCVQTATLTLPPSEASRSLDAKSSSFSNRFTSPTAYQKLLRRQHQHRPDALKLAKIRESTIFLQIEKKIYQMDLSQVENVDVQLEENVPATEDEDAGGGRPPSLLIQFGNLCVFRIFSLTGIVADNFSALKSVQTLLVQLLTAEDHVPSEFPNHNFSSSLASPAGSSATVISSSNEPGQRDFARQPANETPPCLGSNSKPKSPTNTGIGESSDAKMEESPAVAAGGATSGHPYEAPKRQSAYAQAKRDLQLLQDVLMRAPLEADNVPSKRLRMLQDQVQTLCTSIPENLSMSYLTQSQLQSVMMQQKERIQEYEKEMDALLKSFWPAGARMIGRVGQQQQQSTVDRRPQLPAKDCIVRANQLLEMHKQAVDEQLALSLLPTRGS